MMFRHGKLLECIVVGVRPNDTHAMFKRRLGDLGLERGTLGTHL